MAIFDPIKLTWAGKTYSIPADKVLGAIARVEDVVTMEELSRYMVKKTMPYGKLAQAYGAVLRYAGAVGVTDDEIYVGMFGGSSDKLSAMHDAIMTLLAMMLPPGALEMGGKSNPTPRLKGAHSSSKKTTKP